MDAGSIAQAYLDEVSALVMAGDWDAYTDVISRPFLLVTHASTISFASPDEIRGLYRDFVMFLRTQRVTDYIRLVEAAEQIDLNLISVRYVTHLMSGSHRIMDPVQSSMSLRLEGNRWRAASITNAVSSARWPLLMPRPGHDTLASEQSLKGPDHD